jgi:hypothetical protein
MVRDSDWRIAKRKSAGATDDDWFWLVHEEPMAHEMGSNALGITRCLGHGCMAGSALRTHEQKKGKKLDSTVVLEIEREGELAGFEGVGSSVNGNFLKGFSFGVGCVPCRHT